MAQQMINGRVAPMGPVQAWKTYSISAPLESHFRAGSCAEANCPHYLNGWATACDEATPDGQAAAAYIRRDSKRSYTEHRGTHAASIDGGPPQIVTGNGGPLTVFQFEPGQRCFQSDQHRISLEREPLYLVRDGDWRAQSLWAAGGGLLREHVRGVDWVEDSHESFAAVSDARDRG